MKYPTHKAASLLNIHPVDLIYHLASLEVSFEDVWPNVDESCIEAIKGHFGGKSKNKNTEQKTVATLNKDKPTKTGISKNAGLVVEKLYRNGKWDNVSASFESIENLTHLPTQELEEAIQELETKYLIKNSEYNSYGLNPGKNSEIEYIIIASKKSRPEI